MNEFSDSARDDIITIPSFYRSRLSTIADKLNITPIQAIQALFTWTEMGLSLAEQLEVDELTPQAVFESIEQLQASGSSSSVELAPTQSVGLDSHNVDRLVTSIQLLSQAVSDRYHNQSKSISDVRSAENLWHSERASQTTSTDKQLAEENLSTGKGKSSLLPNSGSLKEELSQSQSKSKWTRLAEEEVGRAIDAIIQFNNQENISHKDKWHIGVSALRKLTRRGDSVIKRVLEPRTAEIQQHHAVHQIGLRHNSKGRDYPSIDEIISLNLLDRS